MPRFCDMIFSASILRSLVIVSLLVSAKTYSTLHTVDVQRVVCPKQQGMSQESVINISLTPEVNKDGLYIFSFLRVSEQPVNLTFKAVDSSSPPKVIVPEQTVTLAGFDGMVPSCTCTGQSNLGNGLPEGYGSSCKAWDHEKCAEINGAPTGSWCCDPWCYVDKECDSGWQSTFDSNVYFSYGACDGAGSPSSKGVCPWPKAEELAEEDPCACLPTASSLFTEAMSKLPKEYGAKCAPHDQVARTCEQPSNATSASDASSAVGYYTAAQVDSWCCEDWCYVQGGKECATAIASINEGLEDKLFWSKITCDLPPSHKEYQDQITRSQQCPYKRMSDNVESVSELCACLDTPMPEAIRTMNGISSSVNNQSKYGAYCWPWDAFECHLHYKGADTTDALWCCSSWCYVDPKCPHANKDSRWSLGYISYDACKDETEQLDRLSSCDYSNACDCTGSNAGLRNISILGDDYGKECKPYDADECKAMWGPTGILGSGWNESDTAWCCQSWCYVKEGCPISEKSWTGADLWWSPHTCDDDPKLKYSASQGKCEATNRLLLAEPDVTRKGDERSIDEEAQVEQAERGDSTSTERLLSARRRVGSRRRNKSVQRRRVPPPDSRRRAPAPKPSAPSGSDTRRRSSGGSKAPSPSGGGSARRRQPPPQNQRRRQPPPQNQRRRSAASELRRRSASAGSISGKKYNAAGAGGASYGYTSKSKLQNNFGGKMPAKRGYGFSGKQAVKQNSKVKLAMMGGAVVGGAALGVGAYYAYQRYGDWNNAREQSWCERKGTFYDCEGCRAKFGQSECNEDADCFSSASCSYYSPDDLARDDLMSTGFIPSLFTAPFQVKVTKMVGASLTQADLKCDSASLELAKGDYKTTLSFKPLLYLTMAEVDQLDDDPVPEKAVVDGSWHGARPGLTAFLTVLLAAFMGLPRRSFGVLCLACLITVMTLL